MSGVVKSLMKKELEAMQKQFDAKNEEMKKELDTKNKVIEACNKKISDLEQERQQKQQQQLLEQLQAQQQQIQQLQQLLQSNVSPPLVRHALYMYIYQERLINMYMYMYQE